MGRKPVLALGLTGEVIAYLVFGEANSLGLLYVARVIAGAFAANIPVIQSYVSDVTDEETRIRGLGVVGAGIGLGFVVGPAIAAPLSLLGLRVPIFAASALAGANLAFLALFIREPVHFGRSRKANFRKIFSRASSIFVSGGLVNLAFVSLQVTIALYGQKLYGWGAYQVGIILFMIGLEEAVIQGGLIHRLFARVDEWRIVLIGVTFFGGCFLLLSVRTPEVLAYGALFLLGVGLGLSQPATASLVSKLAAPGERGSALGLVQSIVAGTNVLGPVLAGFLYQYSSINAPYRAGLLFTLVALGVFVYGKRTIFKELSEVRAGSQTAEAAETVPKDF
ncbi:MAG: MFS transporter [Candidatus Marsarchaeota archaeon]|nr:MFS transporter [Candidatus Marsarchaeota archaeon]